MSDQVYVAPTPGLPEDSDDVVVGTEVETLLEANPNRKSALIVNLGDGEIRVTTDGTDPSPTRGKPLGKGDLLEIRSPYCSTLEVKAIRSGDTSATVNASEVN